MGYFHLFSIALLAYPVIYWGRSQQFMKKSDIMALQQQLGIENWGFNQETWFLQINMGMFDQTYGELIWFNLKKWITTVIQATQVDMFAHHQCESTFKFFKGNPKWHWATLSFNENHGLKPPTVSTVASFESWSSPALEFHEIQTESLKSLKSTFIQCYPY